MVSRLEDSDEVMHQPFIDEGEEGVANSSQKFDNEELQVDDSQQHEMYVQV